MSEGGGDIIIKKIIKKGGGGHAAPWKIAYADFVTAMMAFFLLLWLLSSVGEGTLKGIAEYFSPTMGVTSGGFGFSINQGQQQASDGKGADKATVERSATNVQKITFTKASSIQEAIEAENFTDVEYDLYKTIYDSNGLKEYIDNILIDQSSDGLRIQLLDDDKRPMFIPGTAILQPYTKDILAHIAKYIKLLPNYLSITGHTNSVTKEEDNYWKLSALRAESAREFLVKEQNIDKEQIAKIVGKADQDPYDKKNPYSASNMRISIVLLKNSIVPHNKKSVPSNIELEQGIRRFRR